MVFEKHSLFRVDTLRSHSLEFSLDPVSRVPTWYLSYGLPVLKVQKSPDRPLYITQYADSDPVILYYSERHLTSPVKGGFPGG